MKNHFNFCILVIVLVIAIISLNSCTVKKTAGLDYGVNDSTIRIKPQLNIFQPERHSDVARPVLIFVYGGNWNSGRKEIYNYVGRNFAKHDMVTIIPDYTKSPNADYDKMTTQIATSIKWVKENIESYGGDPQRIFLMGHSAGGHLVALAAMNPKYGINPADIKGIILNDAAGLDMETYLSKNPPTADQNYVTTWSNNPAEWKNASPINYIDKSTPKFKIYTGAKTYASITSSNNRFLKQLKTVQPDAYIQVLDKGHVPMVSQLFWPWNNRFEEIRSFMSE